MAFGIASSFNWLNLLVLIHFSLAEVFCHQGNFDDAHTHIERAKLYATNDHDTFLLARAMELQAGFLHKQRRLEEAKSEALRAVDTFEKLGATYDVKSVKELLQRIDHDEGSCP